MAGHRSQRAEAARGSAVVQRLRLPAVGPNGRVFALGVAATVAVVSITVGLTWAGSDGDPRTPVLDASPVPSTAPGDCTLLVDGRAHQMDVDRARTLTMVSAVGAQVKAIPAQTARAFDLALAGPTHYLPTVTAALQLLARDDSTAPSPISLAEVSALNVPGSLSCTFTAMTVKAQPRGANGLTPRADAVRANLADAFGKLSISGFGKGAHPEDAAGAVGRALDVAVGATPASQNLGWQVANWLVARGSAYVISGIAFDDHTWTPADGWKDVMVPSGAPAPSVTAGPLAAAAKTAAAKATAARHLNRVHVIVAAGS
ncbi:MAG TPA: hypothetical protein VGL04_10640 [Sporichthyaceae bacterium]|jgi:hypothetical protein